MGLFSPTWPSVIFSDICHSLTDVIPSLDGLHKRLAQDKSGLTVTVFYTEQAFCCLWTRWPDGDSTQKILPEIR